MPAETQETIKQTTEQLPLYGHVVDETQTAWVACKRATARDACVGVAYKTNEVNDTSDEGRVRVYLDARDELCCDVADDGAWRPATVKTYAPEADGFSRNAGILESRAFAGKAAIIVGCGSVGSTCAHLLVRAGVQNFILVDTDTLEIHNLSRHMCGMSDLGRYKTDAVRDLIHETNPHAYVGIVRKSIADAKDDVQDMLWNHQEIDDACIVATCDSRAANAFASDIAVAFDMTYVSISCYNRAETGEVFWWASETKRPCYRCTFEKLIDEDDAHATAHQRYFAQDEDVHDVSFIPGIAADVERVANLGTSVAIDLLQRQTTDAHMRFLPSYDMAQMMLISNVEGNLGKPFEIKEVRIEAAPHCACADVA
jgi:molybdopterin/thiamine biosynthesis adenylyltransferase